MLTSGISASGESVESSSFRLSTARSVTLGLDALELASGISASGESVEASSFRLLTAGSVTLISE